MKRISMSNDGFEILDAHDKMLLVLCVEVFEVSELNGNGSLQWLLQDLYNLVKV